MALSTEIGTNGGNARQTRSIGWPMDMAVRILGILVLLRFFGVMTRDRLPVARPKVQVRQRVSRAVNVRLFSPAAR